MNRLLFKIITIFIVFFGTLHGETMYLLTKIPKTYLVVENYSSKVSMDIKEEILEEMKIITDELQIDTSGYSHRALGFMIYETAIDSMLVLNIDLILGEEVKRIDDAQEVYALTYDKRKQISLNGKTQEEIQDQVIDIVYLLLGEFMEQYKEDNR